MRKYFNLVLAAAVFSSCAFAGQITQDFTFGQTAESFNLNFNIQQFNPALGTLTAVQFQIAGVDVGTATLRNDNSKRGTYTFQNQSDLFITTLNGVVVFDEVLPMAFQSAVLDPGASVTFTGVISSATATTVYSDVGAVPFILTFYDGTGSPASQIDPTPFLGADAITLTFHGDNLSNCVGASVSCTTSSTGGGNVRVVYDFTSGNGNPVPEPATMGLLGSALVGLGFWKFRGKSSSVSVS